MIRSSVVIWSGWISWKPMIPVLVRWMRLAAHSLRSRPGAHSGTPPPGSVCWLPRMLKLVATNSSGLRFSTTGNALLLTRPRGVLRLVRSPRPSWPRSLLPQQTLGPSTGRAQTEYQPASTLSQVPLTLLTPPRRLA